MCAASLQIRLCQTTQLLYSPQHTELITFGIHVGVSDIISHTTALITSIQFKLVGQRSQPSVNSISQASLHIL